MKRSHIIGIILFILLVIYSVINLYIDSSSKYILITFLGLITLLSYKLLGFQKNKSLTEKDTLLTILVYLIGYYLIIYIIGYFIGFTRNIYNLGILSIIKNIFPVILIIFLEEILRYIINKKIEDKKLLILLSFFSFTCIYIYPYVKNLIGIDENDTLVLIQQLGLFIIPAVTTNILLTYTSMKAGYKTSIIYRLLIEIPVYLLPIFPNFGDYLESVVRTSIPIILFLWLYKEQTIKKLKQIVVVKNTKALKILEIPAILFCLVLIYLLSGYFKYTAFVIATGSMQPNINIGDVVIIKKLSDDELKNLEVGDVIAYKKDDIVICHRIIKVVKSGSQVYYQTQGDNNPSPDQLLVETTQIKGITNFKINYIGYPTVYLHNLK